MDKDWKIGGTKKWYTYFRTEGKGRWVSKSNKKSRDVTGEGISEIMDLKLTDS